MYRLLLREHQSVTEDRTKCRSIQMLITQHDRHIPNTGLYYTVKTKAMTWKVNGAKYHCQVNPNLYTGQIFCLVLT